MDANLGALAALSEMVLQWRAVPAATVRWGRKQGERATGAAEAEPVFVRPKEEQLEQQAEVLLLHLLPALPRSWSWAAGGAGAKEGTKGQSAGAGEGEGGHEGRVVDMRAAGGMVVSMWWARGVVQEAWVTATAAASSAASASMQQRSPLVVTAGEVGTGPALTIVGSSSGAGREKKSGSGNQPDEQANGHGKAVEVGGDVNRERASSHPSSPVVDGKAHAGYVFLQGVDYAFDRARFDSGIASYQTKVVTASRDKAGAQANTNTNAKADGCAGAGGSGSASERTLLTAVELADSKGDDIRKQAAPSGGVGGVANALKSYSSACDQEPGCGGFNSNGWLKRLRELRSADANAKATANVNAACPNASATTAAGAGSGPVETLLLIAGLHEEPFAAQTHAAGLYLRIDKLPRLRVQVEVPGAAGSEAGGKGVAKADEFVLVPQHDYTGKASDIRKVDRPDSDTDSAGAGAAVVGGRSGVDWAWLRHAAGECARQYDCGGFNSNGWLKRVPPLTQLDGDMSVAAEPTLGTSGGLWGSPVVLGDLQLPASARLRLHRFENQTEHLDLVTIADVPSGTAGALLNVRFDASNPTSYGYLEACMRAMIDGATTPMFLSSGAEDYFLSAYYFNEGEFKTPNSGLTYFDGHGTLSAYKTHDRDPVLWSDSLKLVFRNCESTTGCGTMAQCPNQFCPPNATAVETRDAQQQQRDVEATKPMPRLAGQQTSKAGTAAYYKTLVYTYERPKGAEDHQLQTHQLQQQQRRVAECLRFVVRLGSAKLLSVAAEQALVRAITTKDERVLAAVAAYAEQEQKQGEGQKAQQELQLLLGRAAAVLAAMAAAAA
eukprot:g1287.t1